MTTPARQEEADAASIAFHLALTQLGVQAVEDALVLWEDVPPNARPAAASAWLDRAVRLVLTRRGFARELALAYYRLVRALHTGRTIPGPGTDEPTSVTLGQLRDAFANLAGSTISTDGPAEEAPTRGTPSDERPSQETSGGRERIPVDTLPGADTDEAALASSAREEAEIALAALGPLDQEKRVRQIGDDVSLAEARRLEDQAHAQSGARQASAAERVALDGGRSTLWTLSTRDKLVVGYVRVSRTGTPCGWCAMLISRGAVYRSEKSATYGGGAASYDDGDKYHDNCHCYAMPVFSREQYASSEMFELNRKYSEEWPAVTRGLSGKAALSAWRAFIRREQQARDQASRAPSPIAQEA